MLQLFFELPSNVMEAKQSSRDKGLVNEYSRLLLLFILGKHLKIFLFFIFCSILILESCHVTTIKGCWLKFIDTTHLKTSLLSSYSFHKITFVLPSLLSVTLTYIT